MEHKMSIVECEDRAKDEGYDKATFDLVGIGGRRKCKWLDAYMGLFMMEDEAGFNTTKQVKEMGSTIWCENFEALS